MKRAQLRSTLSVVASCALVDFNVSIQNVRNVLIFYYLTFFISNFSPFFLL